MQIAIVRLAVVAALLMPGAAWAGKTITHPFAKRPHSLYVPDNWSHTTAEDEVSFKSPDGAVAVKVIGIESDVTQDASELATYFGNEFMKKAGSTGIKMSAPSGIRFVDTDGAYVTLTSTSSGGKKESALVLLAKAEGLVYLFVASGDEDKVWDASVQTGLEEIRLGVRLAGKAAPSAKATEAVPEKQMIDHPGWGLRVDGLPGIWEVQAAGDAYVLFSKKPQAAVVVEHLAAAPKKVKGAKPGQFGPHAALVVESTTEDGIRERSYHIARGGDGIVVRFSSVTFDESEKLIPELAKAFQLTAPGIKSADGATTVPLPHGVVVTAPKGWKVVNVGSEQIELEGPQSAVFLVRVFRLKAHERYPFQDDRYTQERKCEYSGRTFSNKEIKVERSGRAKVYTCTGPEGGALLYLVASESQTQPVYVSLVGFYDRTTNEIPEQHAADLIKQVSLPRSDK